MNYEPIIESIAKLIGVTAKTAESAEGRAPAHTTADVERWLGPLTKPEKQVPLIHDYLRGQHALAEAEATGATHVRDVSVPVWQSADRRLQAEVDADPEVQAALRQMYVGRNTPKMATDKNLDPGAREPDPVSTEVPADTPVTPARPRRIVQKMTADQQRQQSEAWGEFADATQAQDAPRIDAALERVKALSPDSEPANPKGTVEQVPGWRRAIDYMASVEQQVQAMQAQKVPSEDWSRALESWRKTQGIDDVAMPKHVRDAVTRFEAWADSMKPPSAIDRVNEVLGAPRTVMSSIDFSAPGRQGILMLGRPEYWQSFRPMFEAWDPAKYAEQQAYLRSHPDYPVAKESGLAITGIDEKMSRREEAFQSRLAERIPGVKRSEQAYTTFLNRLRMDVFSNELKAATAAGVDVGADKKFLTDLAGWINTATGRGGGKDFQPGVLSTILFSPRLAWARFQTLNPLYYAGMHPQVRQMAIKQNLAAAAAIYGLVSLAGLAGARVTWDFRNPDAGKVRVGNTRLDLGGGLFQFIRLYTQLARQETVNPDTGKVTKLGSGFGVPTGLDLVTRFIVSKEAPVASFVTDWMRGKDTAGRPFKLSSEVISRITPLVMQDMYDVLKDKGVEGLLYLAPATFGVGVQTYAPSQRGETIPFIGVKGEVPPEKAAEYRRLIEAADIEAATRAAEKSKGMNPYAAKAVLRAYVRAGRLRARAAWIRANQEQYRAARQKGEPTVPLTAPPGAQP